MSSDVLPGDIQVSQGAEDVLTYREALHEAMRLAMKDERVIILGQGVDDHKGIFGTTLGLAEAGSLRVLDTPLAEEATTGVALGAALNGLYPIQTHIRADFGLLAMNQIINLIAKYKYMFGGAFEVPMLIRMVIGRSWGQGAQHSQSLQSLFGHIPGLTVIMPATAQSVLRQYPYLISEFRGPVISFEHRLLYELKFRDEHVTLDPGASPLTSYKLRDGDSATIVATSIMVLEAQRACDHLEREAGISCDLIDLNCISHPDVDLVLDSVAKTGKLLVADTSWKAYGVVSEVCRMIAENAPSSLRAPVVSLGMQPAPCPTAKSLEDMFYPGLGEFVDELATLIAGTKEHGIPLPDERSMVDVYKHFKGPF